MHFAFDPQQHEFRAQLRALADKQCTPADLRDAWASQRGWSPERYKSLGELGVLGVTVPVEHGGLGLGFVDLVLLLEEAGRSGLPEPLMETLAVGVPLMGQLPDGEGADLARRLLPAVAAGDAAVGVAGPGLPTMVGAGAQIVFVWVDGDLYALEGSAASGASRRSIDGSRHFVDVRSGTSPETAIAEGDVADRLWRSANDRGAWAAAAVLVGVADRLVDMAAQYAKARLQFGRPIGSFQAVKHHLADALVRLEFARPLVYGAAWALDVGEAGAARHVSLAKAAASDAGSLAASVALQVHGAIGYTWEHDLHLWMKRAWAPSAAWGDAGWHRARLLDLVDW
jgi:alkylation response protein AidB-like acyl-CoA dehydrogenase